MDSVTVYPKFQVVVPQRVREQMAVKAGDLMQVAQYGDRIELIPERPARELRGGGPDVNVVDSSAWLECFADGPPVADSVIFATARRALLSESVTACCKCATFTR